MQLRIEFLLALVIAPAIGCSSESRIQDGYAFCRRIFKEVPASLSSDYKKWDDLTPAQKSMAPFFFPPETRHFEWRVTSRGGSCCFAYPSAGLEMSKGGCLYQDGAKETFGPYGWAQEW